MSLEEITNMDTENLSIFFHVSTEPERPRADKEPESDSRSKIKLPDPKQASLRSKERFPIRKKIRPELERFLSKAGSCLGE